MTVHGVWGSFINMNKISGIYVDRDTLSSYRMLYLLVTRIRLNDAAEYFLWFKSLNFH